MSESNTVARTTDATVETPTDRLGIPALVVATTISNLGNGITTLAIPWFVLVTTGSPARTGLATGLITLAYVLSNALGGPLIDRVGFKRASILSDLLSGVTVAIIPTLYLLDWLEFWHLLVLTFAGAVFDGPGGVARIALIPRLARQAGMPLERANSAMQFADQSSRMLLGPLAAGGLIGLVGAASMLYVDAATFALSILVIGLLVRVPASAMTEEKSAEPEMEMPANDASFLASTRDGFSFVAQDDFLRPMVPVTLLYNFIVAPTFAVMLPVLADDEFGSAGALGLMIAAFGAGSAAGTLLYGWQGHAISRYWTFMAAVTMIAVGFWLLPFTTSVWIGVLGTGIIGLAIGPTNALGATIIQERVPEEMFGRVFGFLGALAIALAPLGIFLAGGLIEVTGLRPVMVAAAIGATIAMLRVFAVRSIFRQIDAPIDSTATGG